MKKLFHYLMSEQCMWTVLCILFAFSFVVLAIQNWNNNPGTTVDKFAVTFIFLFAAGSILSVAVILNIDKKKNVKKRV